MKLRHTIPAVFLDMGGVRFFFFLPAAVSLRRSSLSKLAKTAMEPPSKKARTLWDDDNSSDSGDDSGGVSLTKAPEAGFKINEDYARRFEYNKKREEVQKRMAELQISQSNSNSR